MKCTPTRNAHPAQNSLNGDQYQNHPRSSFCGSLHSPWKSTKKVLRVLHVGARTCVSGVSLGSCGVHSSQGAHPPPISSEKGGRPTSRGRPEALLTWGRPTRFSLAFQPARHLRCVLDTCPLARDQYWMQERRGQISSREQRQSHTPGRANVMHT